MATFAEAGVSDREARRDGTETCRIRGRIRLTRLAPLRYIISLLTVIPVGRRPIELRPGRRPVRRSRSPRWSASWSGCRRRGSCIAVAGPAATTRRTWYRRCSRSATVALLTRRAAPRRAGRLRRRLGSRRRGPRRLAVMKDSSIGALGAAALLFVVLLQADALGSRSVAITARCAADLGAGRPPGGRARLPARHPRRRPDGLGATGHRFGVAARAALVTVCGVRHRGGRRQARLRRRPVPRKRPRDVRRVLRR